MSQSIQQRILEVTFTKGQGSFAGTQANTVTLSGLKCSALIAKAGGVSQGELDLRIWGMGQSLMNQLSQVGPVPFLVPAPNSTQAYNTVTVKAGTTTEVPSIVYQGAISYAAADYQGAPDVAFQVTGLAALGVAVMPAPPTSQAGSIDVAQLMAKLAGQMGLGFENGGVNGVKLPNAYYDGSPYQQAEDVARDAGINMMVDDGTLAIWPYDGNRPGTMPLISPSTGMVGYPVRTPIGLNFTTLFNPHIKFGAQVQVQSSLMQACGTWSVISLSHHLESMTVDGAWFSDVTCTYPGYVAAAT